jgi:hypothetical protein
LSIDFVYEILFDINFISNFSKKLRKTFERWSLKICAFVMCKGVKLDKVEAKPKKHAIWLHLSQRWINKIEILF